MPINIEISNNPDIKNHLPLTIALLLFILFTNSCKSKKPQPPIPEKTMEKVIVDIQLAESYSLGISSDTGRESITRFQKNTDSLFNFYSAILNHYDLSYATFREAVDWYKNHPDNLDTLLSGAIEELNRQKAKLGIVTDPDTASIIQENKPAMAPEFDRMKLDHQPIDTGKKIVPVLHSKQKTEGK
jgi:hypothetical protein